MSEFQSRINLVEAFLSALTEDELRVAENFIQNKLKQLPKKTLSNQKISIIYGTETGNSKKIANELMLTAKKNGIIAKISSTDQYNLKQLTKEEYLFIVISTQGEGEPPNSALSFYNYLHTTKEKLNNIKYAVLGLGDTSYPLFCQTGIDIDKKFSELGGERILELQKADVDYHSTSTEWIQKVMNRLVDIPNSPKIITPPVSSKVINKIYSAKVKTHINLNDNRSEKKTYHIELETESDIEYTTGDIAVITAKNNPSIVQEILQFTKSNPERKILFKEKESTLEEILTSSVNISYLSNIIQNKISEILDIKTPIERMDLIDLLKKYSIDSTESLISILSVLNPISPRQYSISSSPLVNENEVHLTVAKDFFNVNGISKIGLCSGYLSDLKENENLTFTIKSNPHFRLPGMDKDMIMIGPGTGIAPFRAFLAERNISGASGKNWLFFGDRKFTQDFLYQTEWQEYYNLGVLSKISLAWSRDKKEKYYVQDEIRKSGKEFVKWLKDGAYLYICGAKNPMSIDVEKAILEVLSKYDKLSKDKAQKFLQQMEDEGRYLKDVY